MMNNNTNTNIEARTLTDAQTAQAVGGYTSTDHYTTTQLSTPITCSVCGGNIYSLTANNYGPNRVLKSVTYHCSGNGTHPAHDVVVNYM